jgi:hypothetical protein
MKPLTIGLIGCIGLAGVFLFEFYVPAVLLILSGCTLVLILGGTFLPANSRTFQVKFSAAEAEVSPEKRRRFEGRILDPTTNHSFEARMQMTRIWRLAILGIVALLEIALIMALYESPFQPVGEMDFEYFMVFCLCFASTVQVAIAARWLLERRLLSISALAIGDFDAVTGSYIFCDERGDHYGGTKKPTSFEVNDNTCLVFYSSGHPQISVPSFQLLFHRLLLR